MWTTEQRAVYIAAWQRSPRGRAKVAWANLTRRVKTLRQYRHVKILVSREDFIAWYLRELAVFTGIQASVDRIDSKGHYEFPNMRMLEMSLNCRFHGKNRLAPKGHVWCSDCVGYVPIATCYTVKGRPDVKCRDHRRMWNKINRLRHLALYRSRGW